MTQQTARFLLTLLNNQQLNAGAEDFEQVAAQVLSARRELQTIIDTKEGSRG